MGRAALGVGAHPRGSLRSLERSAACGRGGRGGLGGGAPGERGLQLRQQLLQLGQVAVALLARDRGFCNVFAYLLACLCAAACGLDIALGLARARGRGDASRATRPRSGPPKFCCHLQLLIPQARLPTPTCCLDPGQPLFQTLKPHRRKGTHKDRGLHTSPPPRPARTSRAAVVAAACSCKLASSARASAPRLPSLRRSSSA